MKGLLACQSEEEFAKEYKLYHGQQKGKEFYILALYELSKSLTEGNLISFVKLGSIIHFVSNTEDPRILRDCQNLANNPINNTNLIILACKHEKVKILEYLFSKDNRVLYDLSTGIGKPAALPQDIDEYCHNAFYYAIRSNNINLLSILINDWPDKYFSVYSGELDEILSRTYEELTLKNVPLDFQMTTFIEAKLVNLRFCSSVRGQEQNADIDLNNIKQRIELLLQTVRSLINCYTDRKEVDGKFLYKTTSIAQNIHVVKRQLKFTYDSLPWEEIEFCLVCFVSSHSKKREINLFYHSILNPSRILIHLSNFGKKLESLCESLTDMNFCKFSFPKFKRGEVVARIIGNQPEFEDLYADYQQIRDVTSLLKINDYIKLALSADIRTIEGKLCITRVLQIVGEYLKNSLESPKLSDATGDLILLSLPNNTRKIITDIRNCLSHAYSLSQRIEMEENTDISFFTCIQNDIKKVGTVIADVLQSYKIKTVRMLLERATQSETLNDLKEFAAIFKNVDLSDLVPGNFHLGAYKKIENLVKSLSNKISDKTSHEEEMFSKISSLFSSQKAKLTNEEIGYRVGFGLLPSLNYLLSLGNFDDNCLRIHKFSVSNILKLIGPKEDSQHISEMEEILKLISASVLSRKQNDHFEIQRILIEIFFIAVFDFKNVRGIEELLDTLKKKNSSKQANSYQSKIKKCNNQLTLKISQLETVLKCDTVSSEKSGKVCCYKRNKKLQSVVEILMLDILSLLECSTNRLVNNLYFLDDYSPLLNGKALRNHLAHDNALVDILRSDPSVIIFLNAEQFLQNIMGKNRKLGKFVIDDPLNLKNKLNFGIYTITNQEKMFAAIEKGNLQNVKKYLKNGAEVNGRDINLWTSLHFAVKGSNLETVKFIINKGVDVNSKDIHNQSPLHIASANGREHIAEFLISEVGLCVNAEDDCRRTPLHLASLNGHKGTVEMLLKYKADTAVQDHSGHCPVHYAVNNNHIDVVEVLVKKEKNVDSNELKGGFTLLHMAAGHGHLELVNFLLINKANVNARTDQKAIPLHIAALNGHIETVKALILKGANINARALTDCTPLHYAVGNGDEKIVDVLLQNGALTNVFDNTSNFSPLHYAAQDGHVGIVKLLLKNKVDVNVPNIDGFTPLHFSAQGGHFEITSILLENGVNVNAKDIKNSTPLHHAAEHGHKSVAELLIKCGADVNVTNLIGGTPLHLSAFNGHSEVTSILIQHCGLANIQDREDNTPMHLAATCGNKAVIDILIRNNGNVNSRNRNGITPLHNAVYSGCENTVILLIKNGANINARTNVGMTPLHIAVKECKQDIIWCLIENEAQVNFADGIFPTPLHIAVQAGHKDITEILIAKGADINARYDNVTPLFHAVKCNNKGIVDVLISNGANVNAESDKLLHLAVSAGHRDIVKLLLKNKIHIGTVDDDGISALLLAASAGHKKIVETLIHEGADVNATCKYNTTPLFGAAQKGHEQVVRILLANGANINVKNKEGLTPLHIAVIGGHANVVKLLLENNADVNIRDQKNRSPTEYAIFHGHLDVVKVLFESRKVDIDSKANDDFTLLHVACQKSSLEIVKYLVNVGCNINARNVSGSKPIHIAAREGNLDTVKVLLDNGLSVNEPGTANQTPLHYSAYEGQFQVAEYLLMQDADVNIKDDNGRSPLHIAAALSSSKEMVELLLRYGAIYNSVDNATRKPLAMSKCKDVVNLLSLTEKLFKAVKRNCSSDVENCIKEGASVHAKIPGGMTPLCYCAWKGYDYIANILLQNGANPNVVDDKGFSPLHYGVKFSHIKLVKDLLYNGATYNTISKTGKIPLDFSDDASITSLLKLLDKSFNSVRNGCPRIINDLNKINDVSILKAAMRACNRENKTLILVAMQNKFPKVENLKEISQGDVSKETARALSLASYGKYSEAITILDGVFKRRVEILGLNNPGTLEIQRDIATVLYKKGSYKEASELLEEIVKKQEEMLGINDMETVKTKGIIALILLRQGKDEEAANIYEEVYERQKQILGPYHPDTVNTQFHMALVLTKQGRHEEALQINKAVFMTRKEILGHNHPATLSAQYNIALVLCNQGSFEEALKIYEEVLEKNKNIFGINHPDTLRTLDSIGAIFCEQKKFHEAVKTFQDILKIKKNAMGPYHPETLKTRHNLGNILFDQGKFNSALKVFREGFDQSKLIFGPNSPIVLDIEQKLEMIAMRFKISGEFKPDLFDSCEGDLNSAVSSGNIQKVKFLLYAGTSVNSKDSDGRTTLHYAADNGNVDILNILLENEADVTEVSSKGNTPLHIAASKGHKNIVEILLHHVSRDKLNDFINTKTVGSGTTALHVAAKNGYFDVVKSLLKWGANHQAVNKEAKTPLSVSKDQNIVALLKLVQELFEDVKKGDVEIFRKLKVLKHDEFLAVTNARDNQGNTLLQAALANKHKSIANKLIQTLKEAIP